MQVQTLKYVLNIRKDFLLKKISLKIKTKEEEEEDL